jgi:hypothetical protein
MTAPTMDLLEAGLEEVLRSPRDGGPLLLIVRRPGVDRREVLDEAVLDPERGLVGDTWLERGSRSMPDGSADPAAQLTLMNARFAELIAGDREAWPVAGDQLYVDLDLSVENLPAGTRLAVGAAVIEISPTPHLGCAKFRARFGSDALRLANAPTGRALRLRGANATILEGGTVRTGDIIRRR